MNTITMDTVRDLIERHSDHISGNTREFYNGAYAEIADELNSRADYHGYEQAAIEAWESVKAWNSRAERTCKFDYEQAAEYWQRMYEQTFAERTCHDTGENEWHFVCSACGYEQNGYECWNYCPSCGCKVVGE